TAQGRGGMGSAFPWIESINPDGTGRVQLTHPGDAFEDIHPTWSPDSTKIAFKRYSRQTYFDDIFVMNADGTDLTDITADADIAFDQAVWSGYLPRPPLTLVGTGGTLASACAGFLFGQQDKTVSSTVTFDTAPADRTKTRVEALTGVTPGVPNLVFGISA